MCNYNVSIKIGFTLSLFLILINISDVYGQSKKPEVSFPIAFEDATGAKDTIFYEFDTTAISGVDDLQFNETPSPLDTSKFGVRIMNCAFRRDPYDIPFYECVSNINDDSLYKRDVQKLRKTNLDYTNVFHKEIIIINKPLLPIKISINPKLIHTFLWDYSKSSPFFFLEIFGIKSNIVDSVIRGNEILYSFTGMDVNFISGTNEINTKIITQPSLTQIYLKLSLPDLTSNEKLNELGCGIHLYPAIFSKFVNIELLNQDTETKLEVRNMWGQLVYFDNFKLIDNKLLDLSFLPNGFYSFNFYTNKIFTIFKTVKTE